jgi:chemotaxis protein MotA
MQHSHRFSESKVGEKDIATISGIFGALALIALAMLLGGGIGSFVDPKSLFIVLGGTFGAALVSHSPKDFIKAYQSIKSVFFVAPQHGSSRIRKLVYLSQRARKEGTLALENDLLREKDPFLRKALELIIDNVEHEDIRRVLSIELAFADDDNRKAATLCHALGASAPAMGLLGTLIGLVEMLKFLDDPANIGPAMAVALLTTFYGTLLAHVIFLPLAAKLELKSKEDLLVKEITIEGVLSINEAANPRLIEQKLLGFLPKELRTAHFE